MKHLPATSLADAVPLVPVHLITIFPVSVSPGEKICGACSTAFQLPVTSANWVFDPVFVTIISKCHGTLLAAEVADENTVAPKYTLTVLLLAVAPVVPHTRTRTALPGTEKALAGSV